MPRKSTILDEEAMKAVELRAKKNFSLRQIADVMGWSGPSFAKRAVTKGFSLIGKDEDMERHRHIAVYRANVMFASAHDGFENSRSPEEKLAWHGQMVSANQQYIRAVGISDYNAAMARIGLGDDADSYELEYLAIRRLDADSKVAKKFHDSRMVDLPPEAVRILNIPTTSTNNDQNSEKIADPKPDNNKAPENGAQQNGKRNGATSAADLLKKKRNGRNGNNSGENGHE